MTIHSWSSHTTVILLSINMHDFCYDGCMHVCNGSYKKSDTCKHTHSHRGGVTLFSRATELHVYVCEAACRVGLFV